MHCHHHHHHYDEKEQEEKEAQEKQSCYHHGRREGTARFYQWSGQPPASGTVPEIKKKMKESKVANFPTLLNSQKGKDGLLKHLGLTMFSEAWTSLIRLLSFMFPRTCNHHHRWSTQMSTSQRPLPVRCQMNGVKSDFLYIIFITLCLILPPVVTPVIYSNSILPLDLPGMFQTLTSFLYSNPSTLNQTKLHVSFSSKLPS